MDECFQSPLDNTSVHFLGLVRVWFVLVWRSSVPDRAALQWFFLEPWTLGILSLVEVFGLSLVGLPARGR